jgi:hypothetical protein
LGQGRKAINTVLERNPPARDKQVQTQKGKGDAQGEKGADQEIKIHF